MAKDRDCNQPKEVREPANSDGEEEDLPSDSCVWLNYVNTLSITIATSDMNKSGRPVPRTPAIIVLLLVAAVSLFLGWRNSQVTSALVPYTIQFYKADASEVSLVWGVNGWSTVPQREWPERTRLTNGIMHTEMQPNDGGYFETTVYVVKGDSLQFGFLTTRDTNNATVSIWDSNQGKDYDLVVEEPQTAVYSDVPLEYTDTNQSGDLIKTTIRYEIPFIEQGDLVWGIDGWHTVEESTQSSETYVDSYLMHTLMQREGNELVTTVMVPAGAELNFLFDLSVVPDGTIISLKDTNANNENYTYLVGEEAQTIALEAQPTIVDSINKSYLETRWQRILLGFSAGLILLALSLSIVSTSSSGTGDQPAISQFKITLSFQQVKKIAIIVALLNTLFLLLNVYFSKYMSQFAGEWAELPPIKYLGVQFSFAGENVAATWYSASLLIAVSLAALICFLIDQQHFAGSRARILNYGWLLLAFCFCLLSLDEIGSLHERIGMQTVLNPMGDYPVGWVHILGIPILVTGFFMLLFGWLRLRKVGWTFAWFTVGVFLFLTVPIQEDIESALRIMAGSGTTWERPILHLVLEEGAEIFGSLSFLIAMLLYIATAVQHTEGITISINRRQLFSSALLFIGGAGFLMVLLVDIAPYFEGDTGLPGNWFPGLLSLMIAVTTFISYQKLKTTSSMLARLYILITIFCICLSFYFGGYTPYWLEKAANYGIGLEPYFKYVLSFIAAAFGVLLLVQSHTRLGRLLTVFGTTLLVITLQSPYPTIVFLPYVALSTLLIAMLYHHLYWHRTQEKRLPSSAYQSQATP